MAELQVGGTIVLISTVLVGHQQAVIPLSVREDRIAAPVDIRLDVVVLKCLIACFLATIMPCMVHMRSLIIMRAMVAYA